MYDEYENLKKKLEETNNLVNRNEELEKQLKDLQDFELILKVYKFKNRKKGARQIRMVLENEFKIIFNIKKIRRLMRKFGLKCPIRKANG